MSVTKKIIASNIHLANSEARSFLDSFLKLIKNNSKSKSVKISGFGTFTNKSTVERVGRNPKTNESYKIKASKKLIFKASNRLKKTIN